jgi:hypothetical protein
MPVDALLGIPDMSNYLMSKYEVNFKSHLSINQGSLIGKNLQIYYLLPQQR